MLNFDVESNLIIGKTISIRDLRESVYTSTITIGNSILVTLLCVTNMWSLPFLLFLNVSNIDVSTFL